MKFLIVLCAALACAVAKPQFLAPWAAPNGYAYTAAAPWASPLGHPLAYSAPHWAAAPALAYSAPYAHVAAPLAAPVAVAAPVAHATKSQYHAQDELGQASYGHSEPSQAHHAVQDAFGNKVGSFSYTAPDGRVLRTDYVADALGYRVTSNNLPVAPAGLPLPVHDTPEVAIAKAQHLAAHGFHGLHRIAKRSVALVQTPASTAPLAYAAAPAFAHHAVAYSAAPAFAHHAVAYSAAPAFAHHAVAYSAAPAIAHHAVAAPVAYAAAPAIAHHAVATPLAYAAAPAIAHHTVAAAPVLREAIHTTVVNNPGHAVSYRVD